MLVAVLSSRRPMVSDARNAYECEKWGFLMESSERRRGRGGRRTARRTDDRAAAQAVWREGAPGARVARGKVSDVKKAPWRDREGPGPRYGRTQQRMGYYTQQSTLPSPGLRLRAHCVCWHWNRSFRHLLHRVSLIISMKSAYFLPGKP